MNKKQIIIDYEEYLELEQELEELVKLLVTIYFSGEISGKTKKEIEYMNKRYGWWV